MKGLMYSTYIYFRAVPNMFVKLSQWCLVKPNCFDALLIILEICGLKVKLESNIVLIIIFETTDSLKLEI